MSGWVRHLSLPHTHTHTHTLVNGFSDGIGVSPVDLPAADGPDRLSGSVCDVLLHTQRHTLIQVNLIHLNQAQCFSSPAVIKPEFVYSCSYTVALLPIIICNIVLAVMELFRCSRWGFNIL